MKKLTTKQRAVIDTLDTVDGFNDFHPDSVKDFLILEADKWSDGIYNPTRDDATLYLYPSEKGMDTLELAARRYTNADEIDACDLEDSSVEGSVVIATGGLRLWWD